MPMPQFIPLTLEEFRKMVERFDFSARRIDAVHMHHTWRPNHRDFRGLASIIGMWKFHTETNGWSDIAQHVTIDPSGVIWTGRSWRSAPASSSGHNGTSRVGPFMFEIIGDFDKGKDVLQGAQLDSVIGVITAMQKKNGLAPETLKFHNQLGSPKTCPGNAVSYKDILAKVKAAHTGTAVRAVVAAKRSTKVVEPTQSVFVVDEVRISQAMQVAANATRAVDDPNAGMDDVEGIASVGAQFSRDAGLVEPAPGSRTSAGDLDAATLAKLRPHVVNLVQGEFVPTGIFQTSKADVEAIFSEHLAARLESATKDKPLRIMLWAHGGLVNEKAGLLGAARMVDWWLANDVYPLHFVWETGAMETINQLVNAAGNRAPRVATRDLWDYTTDPLIEHLTRPIGAPLWSGMKRSAERSSSPDGGARFVAERLAQLVKQGGDRVRVHAAGHSAGSIFQCYLLPVLRDLKVTIDTLSFLAPAVTVETFVQQLGTLLKDKKFVSDFTMYTMARDWEKRDSCGKVYRKSLLYLVSRAFEPRHETPILGLEESVRADERCQQIFGFNGHEGVADVVWSRSVAGMGRFASRSETHGGFDNDPATLNSILRRVLQKDDAASIIEYTESRAVVSVDELESVPESLRLFLGPVSADGSFGDGNAVSVSSPAKTSTVANTWSAPTGRRVALCVGINTYPTAPLNGCVADAERWGQVLGKLGFDDVRTLVNENATRDNILASLKRLTNEAQAGDVLVFQYAGHGTQLPDVGIDENDDGKDEALCPVNFDDGQFIIDDDMRDVFASLPTGAALTCFFDCCHSGTITRMAVGASTAPRGVRGGVARARFVRATSAQVEKHLAAQKSLSTTRKAARSTTMDGPKMREVVFSACRSDQVAYESDGHGDFTRIATELLEEGLVASHSDFLERVVHAFGSDARQAPQLDCDEAARSIALFRTAVMEA